MGRVCGDALGIRRNFCFRADIGCCDCVGRSRVRYGCQRSGLFAALLNVLDLVQREAQVDVFNAVKLVRQSRPQFIANAVSNTDTRTASSAFASPQTQTEHSVPSDIAKDAQLSIYISMSLSVCLSVCLPTYLPIYLSIYPTSKRASHLSRTQTGSIILV